MAKTRKVKINKKESKIQKNKKKYNLKECFVKLEKIDHLLRPKTTQNTHTHSLKVFIKKNHLTVNNVAIEESAHRVFNIGLHVKFDRVIIETSINSKPVSKGAVFEEKESTESSFPSIHMITNNAWRRCLAASKRNGTILLEGQHVIAKMKSYCPWPARILAFNANKKRAKVHFYGTQQEGTVDSKDIALFNDASKVIRLLLLRKNTLDSFEKGIREVELENSIPIELSITQEQRIIKS